MLQYIFDDDGSYILNKATGERTALRQENGVYLLDVSIAPPKWKPEQGIPRKAIEAISGGCTGGNCGPGCATGEEPCNPPFGGRAR